MFLPGRSVEQERQERQRIFQRIEQWCIDLIPPPLREKCNISIQEVQCGDPNCAPIDTAITLLFESGGQGIFGLPMEAKEVTMEELQNVFPPPNILEKWHAGEDVDWPEQPDGGGDEPLELRFQVGHHVLCRVGPTRWAPGTVVQLWYREPQWPVGSFAPYKIRLDDGRDIFAPADVDQVIRLNPNAGQPTTEQQTAVE